MKVRNKHVYSHPARIQEIAEETKWIGRHYYEVLAEDHIVIYALPPAKKRKSKAKDKDEPVEEKTTRKSNGYRR